MSSPFGSLSGFGSNFSSFSSGSNKITKSPSTSTGFGSSSSNQVSTTIAAQTPTKKEPLDSSNVKDIAQKGETITLSTYSGINKTTKSNVKISSLLDLEQFKKKDYSLIEIRTYDYINKKLIDPIPPRTTPTPSTQGSTGLFSQVNKDSKPDSSKQTTNLFSSSTETVTPINWDKSELNFPVPPSFQNCSSLPYYKPIFNHFHSSLTSFDCSMPTGTIRKQDYSSLFVSSDLSSKRKITDRPLKFDASLLNCSQPQNTELLSSVLSYGAVQMGLTTFPDITTLQNKRDIPNFRIEKNGIAIIDFQQTADIAGFDFEKNIVIDKCFVDIYRNKRNIPHKGTGLNIEAMITFFDVWPKDIITNERIITKNELCLNDMESQLRNYCKQKEATFVYYDKKRGIFKMLVDNFDLAPFELP